jgi:hypothetical protein
MRLTNRIAPTAPLASQHSGGNRLSLSCVLGVALLLSSSLLCARQTPERAEGAVAFAHSRIVGSWYLALDAEPYGLPSGANLPGLAQFNADRTLRIVDAGDFGGPPFGTGDTAQVGSWIVSGRGRIEATTLFLQADAISGGVLAWFRVQFSLRLDGNDSATGTVNVSLLECDKSAPLPVFACPDPIARAGDFMALPPVDVPVALKRVLVCAG